MKRTGLSVFIIFLMAGFSAVRAEGTKPGLVSIKPEKPAYQGLITIQYLPPSQADGTREDLKSVQFLLYKNLQNPPESSPMEKINNAWTTWFTISDTSVKAALFAFRLKGIESGRSDNNAGRYWDLILFNPDGSPVIGAHQAIGLSYTGFGSVRIENFEEAKKELQKEITLYPDNYGARILLYKVDLKQGSNSETVRSKIEKEVDELVWKKAGNLAVLNFAAEAYRMTGNLQKAQKTEDDLVRRDPKGNQAAKKTLEEILQSDEVEKKITRLERFLTEFPNSDLTELALTQLTSSVIEADDTTRMVSAGDNLLEKSSTLAGASGLSGLAGVLAEKQFELDRALAYAQKSLSIIRSIPPSARPPEIPPQEWKDQRAKTEARYRDILGWIYFQKGEMAQALTELRAVAETAFQPELYYHLASALERTGAADEALVYYGRAAGFGMTTGEMAKNAFDELWLATKKDTSRKQDFLEEQAAWVEKTDKDRVLSRRSVRPAPDFNLEDIDGGLVRLSDQRQNVVLLCFWASWSESSKRVLKELQKLAQDFGKEVLFLTVVTDADRSNIRQFAQKNEIIFPVLINKKTDDDYGIQGVPMLFVIDKSGNIQFEHRGYRPDLGQMLTIELSDLLGHP